MLRQRKHGLLWQRCHLCGYVCRELVVFGVYTAYSECSHYSAVDVFNGGKFTLTMACRGQAFSHLRHIRHLAGSM